MADPTSAFTNFGLEQNTKGRIRGLLRQKMLAHPTFDDNLVQDLLISTRKGVHHILYDEVLDLLLTINEDFPEFASLESIGRTTDNRDIWMLNIDTTPEDTTKGAILMVGAHHARELTSVQMGIYAILELLHGYVQGDAEKIELLKRNKYMMIPFINTDGSYAIFEHYQKTGELMLKRKNNNFKYEAEYNVTCDEYTRGVDINRNYAVHFGNDDGPCGESFPGSHPFSEPETKAMRALLYKHQDQIKFVYNFHAYGPMYIWPYNGERNNTLHEVNPDAELIFNEIWDNAQFPASTLKGNAIDTVGYISNGEANDWIL
jgi:hypothetical protein